MKQAMESYGGWFSSKWATSVAGSCHLPLFTMAVNRALHEYYPCKVNYTPRCMNIAGVPDTGISLKSG